MTCMTDENIKKEKQAWISVCFHSAHYFRNPIQNITGYLSLLLDCLPSDFSNLPPNASRANYKIKCVSIYIMSKTYFFFSFERLYFLIPWSGFRVQFTQRNELIKTTKRCFVEYIFGVLSKTFSWSKKTVLLCEEKYIVNIFYKISSVLLQLTKSFL